jgi:hypothetical protein
MINAPGKYSVNIGPTGVTIVERTRSAFAR